MGGGETPKPAAKRLSHSEIAQWNQFIDKIGDTKEPLESLYDKFRQSGGKIPLDALRNEMGLLAQNVKSMALRRGHIYGEDTNTGNRFPEVKVNGQPAGPMNGDMRTAGPPGVKSAGVMVYKDVPGYVKELHWDSQSNLPFYYDDQGDIKFVEQQHFYSKRFRKGDEGLIARK